LAGNGGAMAETQLSLTTEKVKRATGRKTGGRVAKAGDSMETTGSTTRKERRAGAGRGKSAITDGAERLRWAADRRLGRNSERLAEMLKDRALEGDLASTKVLLALAEGKKPIVEKKGPVRSLALRLAAEPQQEPSMERKATCGGADGACAPGGERFPTHATEKHRMDEARGDSFW